MERDEVNELDFNDDTTSTGDDDLYVAVDDVVQNGESDEVISNG